MHFKLNQSFPFSLLMYCEIFFCWKGNMLKSLYCVVVSLDDGVFYNEETFLVLCQLIEKVLMIKMLCFHFTIYFLLQKKLSPLKFYTFLNLNTRSSSANAYETKRSLYSWLLYRELHCRQRHQNVMDINRVKTWMISLKQL